MRFAPSNHRERLWTPRTWPFIASVLALMTFIAFESFAVTTVLPVAVADLEATGWYSFSYAATITTALIGMVIGGNWTDRSGPRTPLKVGGTLFLLGLVLTVIAPDIATFVVGRLLQGIGGGIDSVILYVLIARHLPETVRPRMFGLLTTAWLVPSLAGPVLAGAMADLMNWRSVFGIIAAGAATSLAWLVHATRTPADVSGSSGALPRRAWRSSLVGRNGTLAVVAAGLLVMLHLSRQFDAPVSTLIVVSVSLALIVTARSILPSGTLMLRGAPQRLIALRAILGATVTTTDLYLTLYLQTERGYPPTTAGLVIAVAAGGWALGAWLQGRLPSTWAAHQPLIVIATLLVAAGPAVALAYITANLPLWSVIIGCISMGTGMGIAYPRLSSATLALARHEEQGAYSSALQSGESMSIGVTTALTAAVLATSGAFIPVYVVLIGLGCTTVLIAAVGTRSCRSPA